MELVRSLLLTDYFDVHVVTTVSNEFFHNALETSLQTVPRAKFTHHKRLLDSGAVQLDALRVDPVESLRRYFLNIHTKREYLLAAEVQWLQSNQVDMVIVDATPLGCAAGKLASIPTVLLTNFTWDFCFREMLLKPYVQDSLITTSNKKAKTQNSDAKKKEETAVTITLDDYENMVSQCTADSFSCDWYIKLPGQAPILSAAQVRFPHLHFFIYELIIIITAHVSIYICMYVRMCKSVRLGKCTYICGYCSLICSCMVYVYFV